MKKDIQPPQRNSSRLEMILKHRQKSFGDYDFRKQTLANESIKGNCGEKQLAETESVSSRRWMFLGY